MKRKMQKKKLNRFENFKVLYSHHEYLKSISVLNTDAFTSSKDVLNVFIYSSYFKKLKVS